MPVITRCKIGIYACQEFNGWFVVRVLRHKFTVNGKVKDFALGLLNSFLQVDFALIYLVNQSKPTLKFSHNTFLFIQWRQEYRNFIQIILR